ncbi:MAG: hypothetical protein JST30_15020 [Armatimonadetes bacterium]|nr:hypothetical protein [Armatimonadota bacterium]
MVYEVRATHNDFDSVLPDHRESKSAGQERFCVGPEIDSDWVPPTLIYSKGKKKIRPNIMSYDQDSAFTADSEAIQRLALDEADWCRLIRVTADALDLRLKPFGPIEFTLWAVTRLVDAIDRSRTTFKPYGDEVLSGSPDETWFHRERLPYEGLFHHKTGASTRILTYDDQANSNLSFKQRYEGSGVSGLTFVPLGNVV